MDLKIQFLDNFWNYLQYKNLILQWNPIQAYNFLGLIQGHSVIENCFQDLPFT